MSGQLPPRHLPYLSEEPKVQVVVKCPEEMENMLLILSFHLLRTETVSNS